MFQEAIVIMLIKCTINIARTFKKPQTIANSNHFLLLLSCGEKLQVTKLLVIMGQIKYNGH